MGGASNQGDDLLVATCGSCAVIQVEGRGSFKTSRALKKFCIKVLEKAKSDIFLDVEDCVGMDSTFMGVLAGIALRIRKEKSGTIRTINSSKKIDSLLKTLGLNRLIPAADLDAIDHELCEDLESIRRMKRLKPEKETAATMLEAHENLVKADKKNRTEFQDVLTYLRKELDEGH